MSIGHPFDGRSIIRSSLFWFCCGKSPRGAVGSLWFTRMRLGSTGARLESRSWFVSGYSYPKIITSRLFFYRYRTPLCILYPPRLIAIACYILSQKILDGANSPSLDARISATAPSTSLPTPPSHKPPSPDASRAAIDYYNLNESDLHAVSGMLLHFNKRNPCSFFHSLQKHSVFFLNSILSKIKGLIPIFPPLSR